MNLSEAITKEIKRKLPIYITISKINNEMGIRKSESNAKEYTEKQKEKQRLILEIKEESKKGKSARNIASEYGVDRRTVAKYINIVDIEETSVYNSSNRNYSYLDLYKDEIIKLLSNTDNISAVYRKLKEKGVALTYSTLKHFISKIKNNNEENYNINKEVNIKNSRNEIIKYIFDWKYKEELNNNIDDIIDKYPIIKTYKIFYQKFRRNLTNLNTLAFVSLIYSNYEDECINKFISSLKTDWEAVLNAASCNISNGITEGSVNKIKQIKRDMYGRAGLELLRKKVIYQSLFY